MSQLRCPLFWTVLTLTHCSTYSYKEMILVADPSRLFQRTAKGSIRNGVTLDTYADEINRCYEAFDEAGQTSTAAPSDWNEPNSGFCCLGLRENGC